MSSRPLAVLIGSPGAGKTTVGRLLAAQLGVALLDTDIEVERRAGKTVSDIFIEDGEETFRALEREVVAEALATHPGWWPSAVERSSTSRPAPTSPATVWSISKSSSPTQPNESA